MIDQVHSYVMPHALSTEFTAILSYVQADIVTALEAYGTHDAGCEWMPTLQLCPRVVAQLLLFAGSNLKLVAVLEAAAAGTRKQTLLEFFERMGSVVLLSPWVCELLQLWIRDPAVDADLRRRMDWFVAVRCDTLQEFAKVTGRPLTAASTVVKAFGDQQASKLLWFVQHVCEQVVAALSGAPSGSGASVPTSQFICLLRAGLQHNPHLASAAAWLSKGLLAVVQSCPLSMFPEVLTVLSVQVQTIPAIAAAVEVRTQC